MTSVFQDKQTVLIVAAKVGAFEIVKMLLAEFRDRLGDNGINQVDEVISRFYLDYYSRSYYCYEPYFCVLLCFLAGLVKHAQRCSKWAQASAACVT